MTSKIALITGASAGIGKQTAMELGKKGYIVIQVVRDCEKSTIAFEEIKAASGRDDMVMVGCDLSSRESILKAVDTIREKVDHIDVLINNAGVMKRKMEETVDGHEMTFAVNYLAPFLLTTSLLDLVKKSDEGRIINVSSAMYVRGAADAPIPPVYTKFNGGKAYSDSKRLLVQFSVELARRTRDDGIMVYSLHPGVVGTDVFREYPKAIGNLLNLFISKPEVGAEPSIYLATGENIEGASGSYFYKKQRKEHDAADSDEARLKQVWDDTMTLLGMAE